MTEKKPYRLTDLVDQCDPNAPMPDAVREWDQAETIGLEMIGMGDPLHTENLHADRTITGGKIDGNHAG